MWGFEIIFSVLMAIFGYSREEGRVRPRSRYAVVVWTWWCYRVLFQIGIAGGVRPSESLALRCRKWSREQANGRGGEVVGLVERNLPVYGF